MLFAVASNTFGAPAAWHLWKSKTADYMICRQQFPGEGWLKIAGPYTSSQCGKYLKQLKVDSTILLVEPKKRPVINK